ncbi:hypothetical protein [Mesorhizobium qingshengii]|uniref:Uncharacterized protein n=1 Tax=Mesorhizobium qingshengii TaxID=1165689 RepID=A0A1G5ZE08_9HYPH|nr:hypothetical protein [Mesorhizobium qingshengii]SDA92786.1 hypothetical protein SAMN02927914_04826 [Mesorhizobium qingshengii]
MTTMQAMEKPRPDQGSGGFRVTGARLLGGLAGQYRALKRRLDDMLMRGDRDYAMLSELSQEIGRMRQRIRADLKRRRDERSRRKAARNAAPEARIGGRGKGDEP